MAGPGWRGAVDQALADAGRIGSWGEARGLFGSTRATAEAAGVSQRHVQRMIAAEEGRAVQSRTPNTARLGGLSRQAALARIRDGAPVSYSFQGDITTVSGGHRGRGNRRRTTAAGTDGFEPMDPDEVRRWAEEEEEDDPDAIDQLSLGMFGPDAGYSINSTDPIEVENADHFALRFD